LNKAVEHVVYECSYVYSKMLLELVLQYTSADNLRSHVVVFANQFT
jgi:hypothetical protein